MFRIGGAHKAVVEFCEKESIGYVRIQEEEKFGTAIIAKALKEAR